MYRRYKLTLSNVDMETLQSYPDYEPISCEVSDSQMELSLQSSNANWILDNWFKNYSADVFLSHSSVDDKIARKVARILTDCGLRVFVDSDLWGRIDKMQRKVDNKHAVLRWKENGSVGTYDYDKRNVTTGHTHVLLTYALTRMIDMTECFLFLSTPNSVVECREDSLDTYSPWLFHELEMSRVIACRVPARLQGLNESVVFDYMDKVASENFSLKFRADTGSLTDISLAGLVSATAGYKDSLGGRKHTSQTFLDHLYTSFK